MLLLLGILLHRSVSLPGGGVLHHRARRHRGVLAGMGGTLAARATLVSEDERPVLTPDDPSGAPGAVAQAGVDSTPVQRLFSIPTKKVAVFLAADRQH